jgi:endonuclease/exonuclease/phosphatase family metal-dependent hydrolase
MSRPDPSPSRRSVRVVTLNFWGLEPPLATRLALAERQLRALAPDLVAMQEVRPMDGSRTTAGHLADALGLGHVYEPAVTGTGAGEPEEGLAILSRHPIAEHRVTALPVPRAGEGRILLSAAIDAPAARVWLHCTHLHYRLDDGVARERQVVTIDEALRGLDAGAPDAPVHVLCGDFNATPDSDEIRFLRGLTTLAGRRTFYQDAFARVHPGADGFTWCTETGAARARRSIDWDRRLDYVFVSARRKDGRGTVRDARVVLDERQGETAASDHYGVLAEIQIAGADPAV